MAVAHLRILPDSLANDLPTFQFLIVQFPQSGMMMDEPMNMEEDLLSTGIDFQRWLHQFKQFPITEANTLSEAADYNAAINLARQHYAAAGRFADLFIDHGSASYFYGKVKIRTPVLPVVRYGALAGSGVSTGYVGSVLTAWRWQATEEGTGR